MIGGRLGLLRSDTYEQWQQMRLSPKMENSNTSVTNAPATNVEVPVRVMTKNPKKVKQGKRLAEWSCKNKEKLVQAVKAKESEPKLSQAYGVGAVIAVGVLSLLGYYIYQRGSPGDNNATKMTPVRSVEVQT